MEDTDETPFMRDFYSKQAAKQEPHRRKKYDDLKSVQERKQELEQIEQDSKLYR